MSKTSVSMCKAAHLYDTTGANGVIYRLLTLEAHGNKCYIISAESDDCRITETLGCNHDLAIDFYDKIVRCEVSPVSLTEHVIDFKNAFNY